MLCLMQRRDSLPRGDVRTLARLQHLPTMTIFRPVWTLTWRLRRRRAERLMSFARAERGSMLDLRLAAAATKSPARAALYLHHADDEQRHERMFARRAVELADKAGTEISGRVIADASDLFDNLGEIKFLAFVHRGERRGRRQFEAHREHFASMGDRKTAELFDAILTDERQHENYTLDLLREVSGDDAATARALRSVALWEGWRRFRRLGRPLAHALYWTAMVILYAACLPLWLWVHLVRPQRRGLHKPVAD